MNIISVKGIVQHLLSLKSLAIITVIFFIKLIQYDFIVLWVRDSCRLRLENDQTEMMYYRYFSLHFHQKTPGKETQF